RVREKDRPRRRRARADVAPSPHAVRSCRRRGYDRAPVRARRAPGRPAGSDGSRAARARRKAGTRDGAPFHPPPARDRPQTPPPPETARKPRPGGHGLVVGDAVAIESWIARAAAESVPERDIRDRLAGELLRQRFP